MKTYPIDFVGFTSYLMFMYIRKITRKKDGKSHAYWALVESRRTERGPRQHVVAYLGEMDAAGRLGVQKAAEVSNHKQKVKTEDLIGAATYKKGHFAFTVACNA